MSTYPETQDFLEGVIDRGMSLDDLTTDHLTALLSSYIADMYGNDDPEWESSRHPLAAHVRKTIESVYEEIKESRKRPSEYSEWRAEDDRHRYLESCR